MVVREQRFSFNEVRQALGAVLGEDLHAKRVDSLSGATLGVLRSASLAVCAIGQGLAAARGLKPKYAVKQVDRLLSNPKINVDDILGRWVPYVVGARTSIVVALDWTDFDADRQATIMLSLITDHGRATPLVWLTVDKRTLKDHRSLYEHRVLVRLAELLPADTKVCVVADRGFGDQKLLCGRPRKVQDLSPLASVASWLCEVSPVRSLLAGRWPGVRRCNRAAPARHRALLPSRCFQGWPAGCPATSENGPAGPRAFVWRQPTVALACADRQAGGFGQRPAALSAQPRESPCAVPYRLRLARQGSRHDRRGVLVQAFEGLLSRDASRVQWSGNASLRCPVGSSGIEAL